MNLKDWVFEETVCADGNPVKSTSVANYEPFHLVNAKKFKEADKLIETIFRNEAKTGQKKQLKPQFAA